MVQDHALRNPEIESLCPDLKTLGESWTASLGVVHS